MRRVAVPRAAWAALPLALLAGGCGLADYEARMQQAQARVNRYDEENRVLGDPIIIPSRKVEAKVEGGRRGAARSVPIVALFLRPPRGISPAPEDEAIKDLVFRYPTIGAINPKVRGAKPQGDGGDPDVRKPAPKAAGGGGNRPSAGGFTDLYLAVGEDSDDFVGKVMAEFPRSEDTEFKNWTREVAAPGRPQKLAFSVTDFAADDADYSVNVYRFKGKRIVVVYRMEKDQRSKLANVVELSLSTFAPGDEAEVMERSYALRPKAGGATAGQAPVTKPITR
jgi:hypothetical protein